MKNREESLEILLAQSKEFYSQDTKWRLVAFNSPDIAKQALEIIQNCLQNNFPDIREAKIIIKNFPSFNYQFRLSEAQWKALQEHFRTQAPRVKPKEDFIYKSLRVDEHNYMRRFFPMVTAPYFHEPVREGPKLTFTVTGLGIFSRLEDKEQKNIAPLKRPQYTPAEKANYSKALSSSLGLADFYPPVFGHNNRTLIGVMFPPEHVLFTDRNFIYDGGTVRRPTDFSDYESAKKYAERKIGKTLFAKKDLDKFKSVIRSDKYNETMCRLRLQSDPDIHKSGRFFIGTDSLMARLWAQEAATILKVHLRKQDKEEKMENLPIIYYIPQTPNLNFKLYTAAEQQWDRLEAQAIYSCKEKRLACYAEAHYEILFSLDNETLKAACREIIDGIPLLLTMLARGFVPVYQSIIDRLGAQYSHQLFKSMKETYKPNLWMQAFYSCLLHREYWLLDQWFALLKKCEKVEVLPDKNPLLLAAKIGWLHWVMQFSSLKYIDINAKDTNGHTALMIAARYGHRDVVRELLKRQNLNINEKNNKGSTALIIAARHGHADIVHELLQHYQDANINEKNNNGLTALMAAARYGHTDTVRELLQRQALKINEKDNDGSTALMLAARYGHAEVVRVLLDQKDIDLSKVLEFNNKEMRFCKQYWPAGVKNPGLYRIKKEVLGNSAEDKKFRPLKEWIRQEKNISNIEYIIVYLLFNLQSPHAFINYPGLNKKLRSCIEALSLEEINRLNEKMGVKKKPQDGSSSKEKEQKLDDEAKNAPGPVYFV